MHRQKTRLVVVGNLHTNPSASAFLLKLAKVLCEIAEEVFVVSADSPPALPNLVWVRLALRRRLDPVTRFVSFAGIQIAVCVALLRGRKGYNQAIVLGTPFVMPVLVLKTLGKRPALYVAQKPSRALTLVACRMSFHLATVLVVESRNVAREWQTPRRVPLAIGAVFVDTDVFIKRKEIRDRKPEVAYVGGLEESKGVLELLEAITLLTREGREISFVFVGSGGLENKVLRLASTYHNVRFRGLVPYSEIPAILNDCRLLVLPSFTEGMPNVVLEAMACGTPVLAAPVGAIPDIITDSENGFVLPNNSPDSVAKHILRALSHANLDDVAENALKTIESKYTFAAALERYAKLLAETPPT